jgi:separase
MLELLDSKRFGKSDELNWPASDLHLAMIPDAESARVTESDAVDGSSPSHRTMEAIALQRRFESFTTMEKNTGKTLTQTLPEGWSVVTINLTDDQNTLFISRQQGNREPLVFAVALNRQCKKEDDEDEQFTFQAATSELRDIIQSSDDTARNAKNIDTRDGRIEWWNTRKALDKRLETLLREIEYSWLGAFKVGRFPAACFLF